MFLGKREYKYLWKHVNQKVFKYIDIRCKKGCCTQFSFDEKKFNLMNLFPIGL